MMIAVAIAALLLGGEATRRRWATLASVYRARAMELTLKARAAELNALIADDMSRQSEPDRARYAEASRQNRQRSEQYLALSKEYEWAARHPWFANVAEP
jgi:hypothetical protein